LSWAIQPRVCTRREMIFRVTLALVALAVAMQLSPLRAPKLLDVIGYVNLLYPAHEIALALNPPEFPWSAVLQGASSTIRDEFKERREQTLRPRGAYTSKDYPGATPGEAQQDGWNTIYLRTGNMDTCLTRYFPKTMAALDSLGVRVHTAFFSELAPERKYIAPHCGQLRGLFRVIVVLDGLKAEGAHAIASMGVRHDHNLCLPRFGQPCPQNVTEAGGSGAGPIELVHYNVGDVVLFNDFVCHWVENHAVSRRLALILNIDRPDLSSVQNWLTAWGSRIFAARKLKVFHEGSQQVCDTIEASGA
jgi:hypothetical protein